MSSLILKYGLVKMREILCQGLNNLRSLIDNNQASISSDEKGHFIDKCAIILRNNLIAVLELRTSYPDERLIKAINKFNQESYSLVNESFDKLLDYQSLHINPDPEFLDDLISSCGKSLLLVVCCYLSMIQTIGHFIAAL